MIGSARFGLWRAVGLEGLMIGLRLSTLVLLREQLAGCGMGAGGEESGGTWGKGRPWRRARCDNDGRC